MKTLLRLLPVGLGIATLLYVAFLLLPYREAPAVPTVDAAARADRLRELASDASNAATNLDHALKSNVPAAIRRGSGSDTEVAELLRVIAELNQTALAQQKTIHDLTTKPAAGTDRLELVVTLVGIASTLLTMWLSWRKDRRELEELRAKVAGAPIATV